MHALARITLSTLTLGALALFANVPAAQRSGAQSGTRTPHDNPQRALYNDPVEFAKLSSAA